MKPYLPTLGHCAQRLLLLTGLWAICQLSATGATTKATKSEKARLAATAEEAQVATAAEEAKVATAAEEARVADEARAAEEPKLTISGIELAGVEDIQRKDLPWLGVSLNEAGEVVVSQLGLDPGVGLVVTYVAPDSPAAKAGLQKNDVLAELQGHPLVLPAQLRKLVQARKEGDVVNLKFYRAGKPQTVSATLAKAAAGVRAVDDEEGASRQLHMRLLGQPDGKQLQHELDALHGSLGYMKIDQKKVQAEVQRSMEQARKSYRDALRNWSNSSATATASRQALEALARSGVLLDNNAAVTVGSTGKSSKSLMKTDDSGTIVLVANPKLHLTAHDQDGKLLFDGEIETSDQRTKVPKEVWEKVEPMLSKMNLNPKK